MLVAAIIFHLVKVFLEYNSMLDHSLSEHLCGVPVNYCKICFHCPLVSHQTESGLGDVLNIVSQTFLCCLVPFSEPVMAFYAV